MQSGKSTPALIFRCNVLGPDAKFSRPSRVVLVRLLTKTRHLGSDPIPSGGVRPHLDGDKDPASMQFPLDVQTFV